MCSSRMTRSEDSYGRDRKSTTWKGCPRRRISSSYSNSSVWCSRRFWSERELSRSTPVTTSMPSAKSQLPVSKGPGGAQAPGARLPGSPRCWDEAQAPLRPSDASRRGTGQPHLGWHRLRPRSHRRPGRSAGASPSPGSQVSVPLSWTLDPGSLCGGRTPSHRPPHSGRSSSCSTEPRRSGFLCGTGGRAPAPAPGRVWGAARGSRPSGPHRNEDRPSCLRGRGRAARVSHPLRFPLPRTPASPARDPLLRALL